MSVREPTTVRLPSTEQIAVASERAILAALDVNLELAIRSLKAEHAGMALDGHLADDADDADDQPYTFLLLPIAEALVLSARDLRSLIATYRTVADDLLDERNGVFEPAPVDIDDVSEDDSLF